MQYKGSGNNIDTNNSNMIEVLATAIAIIALAMTLAMS